MGIGLLVIVVFGLVLVVDGFFGGEVVLLADRVDDVVGDGPHCAELGRTYANLRVRISSWSITSLFLANSLRMSALTACVLTGSLTMRLASLRQSRKMSSTDRFYMSCAGFINKYNRLGHTKSTTAPTASSSRIISESVTYLRLARC